MKISFAERAKLKHGNKYDYSNVVYVSAKTKVIIVCNKCKDMFLQTPNNHLNGKGCPKCNGSNKLTLEQFISRSNIMHNNQYDYSMTNYFNMKTKVKIICKTHGIFEQSPAKHIKENGCPKCGTTKNKSRTKKMNLVKEKFSQRCLDVHGDRYDYSLAEYKGVDTKVKIICKAHGIFEQTPGHHIIGNGCPYCYGKIRFTNEQFISKSKLIHFEKYDYSLIDYKNAHTKIKIKCNQCKLIFKQEPNAHIRGNGCPFCNNSKNISKPEQKWLDDNNILLQNRQHKIKLYYLTYRVDGFNPETNTIYEFFGDYWHGNINNPKFPKDKINKRNKKTFGELYEETMKRINIFKKSGYNVVYIWESEYKEIKK